MNKNENQYTDLLDFIGRSILPHKMQEAIFSIRKQDGTFGWVRVDNIRAFSSKSSASFKAKERFSHPRNKRGRCYNATRQCAENGNSVFGKACQLLKPVLLLFDQQPRRTGIWNA
jgi:hypothetical protein